MLLLGHLQLEQGRDGDRGAAPLAVHLEGCSGVLPHYVVLQTISMLPPGYQMCTRVHSNAQDTGWHSSMLSTTKTWYFVILGLPALVFHFELAVGKYPMTRHAKRSPSDGKPVH